MRLAQDVVLETRGLTRSFRGFVAVDQVDLKVARGTIHAIIGPNGAGKTTLFNLITRFVQASAGNILFEGRNISTLHPGDVAARGMVRSFQISAIFVELTVRENIRLALQRATGTSSQFWRPDSCLDVLNGRADQLADAVGLAGAANLRAGELPYGRKRALELATTLALEPKMLLLDEPTAGMAHDEIGHIITLIEQIAVGRTVLLVEHNLKVVEALSDVITVMQRGRIIAQGNYAHVAEHPEVRRAYLGAGHA